MNTRDLFRGIGREAEVPAYIARRVMKAWLAVLQKDLAGGGKVTLYGLGTFQVKARASKTVLDPNTGRRLHVPAAWRPTFKPSPSFRKIAL